MSTLVNSHCEIVKTSKFLRQCLKMNKVATFLNESVNTQAAFSTGFQPSNAREKIDLAILALMLPHDSEKGIKDAFMHCHLAFDGVSKQALQPFFTGHSAVALEILQGLMSTPDTISGSIYDRAESLSAAQRQHFCNALVVVFGALCRA
jgi:hypothetical protein